MTGILIGRPLRHTERRVPYEDEDRMESHVYEPRNTEYCWQPPEARREARKDSSLEPSEGV